MYEAHESLKAFEGTILNLKGLKALCKIGEVASPPNGFLG